MRGEDATSAWEVLAMICRKGLPVRAIRRLAAVAAPTVAAAAWAPAAWACPSCAQFASRTELWLVAGMMALPIVVGVTLARVIVRAIARDGVARIPPI